MLLFCRIDKTREFVFKIFGVKYHPKFPSIVRDNCTEHCGCGIYPSHLYGRVGIQYMVDVGEEVSERLYVFLILPLQMAKDRNVSLLLWKSVN